MTTRERWIVYPLLFLALGSSLKSHITQRIDCRELVASSIEIVDRRSRRGVVLSTTPEGGELLLKPSPSASTPAQTTISVGRVQTQSVQIIGLNGRPQGLLNSSDSGAILTLLNQDGRGHTKMGAGRLVIPVVQTDHVFSRKIFVGRAKGKLQAALESTTEGEGQLRLINTKDDRTYLWRARDVSVEPAQVDGQEPGEKQTIEQQSPRKETKKETKKKTS